jgi:tetratricopeptide (TPR) repeat protein
MRLILCLFLFVSVSCFGQSNFYRYFEYEFFPKADFQNYHEFDFKWDFEGKLQAMFNSGLTELKEKNYPTAAAHFEEAISEYPDHLPSYYYRAMCYKALDTLNAAIKDLEYLLPRTKQQDIVYYELGEIYQHQQDYDKALKCYNNVRDLAPDRVDGYYGIANISFLRYEPDKAVRFYKKCNEADPKFPDAYLKIALLKLSVNNKENKALAFIDEALQADSTFEDGLFWRGLINTEFGNYGTAVKDWDKLIRLNPSKPFYKLIRGFLYIELNDFDKAFTDLKNAILNRDINEDRFELGKTILNKQIDLYNASTYLMRMIYGLDEDVAVGVKKGFCFILAGKYKSAIDALNSSLKMQPFSCSYLLKAMAFESLEQHDSAYVNYDKALALDKEIFDALKKRAIYRTKRKEWRGAMMDFIAMEKLQPKSPVIFKLRGLLKYNQKDYHGAMVDLGRYLKTDSLNKEILEAYGTSLLNIESLHDSKKVFSKLVRLDSNNYEAHQRLYLSFLLSHDTTSALKLLDEFQGRFPELGFSYIQKMEINIVRKQWDRALEDYLVYSRVKFPMPFKNDSEALYLRGVALLAKNDIEQALESFSQSIDKGEQVGFVNTDSYFRRGKTYFEIGKNKKAVADFKKLVSVGYKENGEFVKKVLESRQ